MNHIHVCHINIETLVDYIKRMGAQHTEKGEHKYFEYKRHCGNTSAFTAHHSWAHKWSRVLRLSTGLAKPAHALYSWFRSILASTREIAGRQTVGGCSFTASRNFISPSPFRRAYSPILRRCLSYSRLIQCKSDPRGVFVCVFIGGLICERQAPVRTLMAVTIEDLYRNYGILADASKENLSQVNKGRRVLF